MNIETLKESLPFLIKAEIPALMVGHHGVGKTQGAQQFAAENKYFIRILNLGTQEVGDIIGLADFVKDKDGNNVATKFMIPDWAKELKEFCEANPDKIGILFLDEINRARRDVLQVVFPLLLEKRIHATIFPKNFYVMAGMNPSTEDYIVTDMSDKALLDRFCHIKLAPSKQEFFKYAKQRKFDDQLVQFLQDQPELLQGALEAFDLSNVTPSRRSWEAVDRVHKLKPPAHVNREIVAGLVGNTAMTAWMKAMSGTDKPINAEDVLNDYSKHKKRVLEYADAKTGGRIDMLKFTCASLIEYAKATKKAIGKDESKNLSEFLWDIPRDLSYSVCCELYLQESTRHVIDEHSDLLTDIANKRGMKVKGVNSEK
jgi:MoxR-like ATPase